MVWFIQSSIPCHGNPKKTVVNPIPWAYHGYFGDDWLLSLPHEGVGQQALGDGHQSMTKGIRIQDRWQCTLHYSTSTMFSTWHKRGTHTWRRGKPPCMAMKDWKNMKHHWKKWCPILQDKPKSGVCQYWKEEMMLARFWENVSFIFFWNGKTWWGRIPMLIYRRDVHCQRLQYQTEYNSSCFESRKCFWMCLICFDYIKNNFPIFSTLKLKRIWAVTKTTSVDWLL